MHFLLIKLLATSSLVLALAVANGRDEIPNSIALDDAKTHAPILPKPPHQVRDLSWLGDVYNAIESEYAKVTGVVGGYAAGLASKPHKVKQLPTATPFAHPTFPAIVVEPTNTPPAPPAPISAEPPVSPRFEAMVCRSNKVDCTTTYDVQPGRCYPVSDVTGSAAASFTLNFQANCYIYKDSKCNPGISHLVNYPGLSEAALAKSGYTGKLKSFKCYTTNRVEDSSGMVGYAVGKGSIALSGSFFFPPGAPPSLS